MNYRTAPRDGLEQQLRAVMAGGKSDPLADAPRPAGWSQGTAGTPDAADDLCGILTDPDAKHLRRT